MLASSSATNASPALLVQPRQTVPGFALPDANGTIIRLRSFRQRRPVLIALLHSATCPDCRAWLSTLSPAREEIDYLTVQPLLIFPDKSTSLSALQHELAIPGKLLSDPRGTARNCYVPIEEPPALSSVVLVAVDPLDLRGQRLAIHADDVVADEGDVARDLAMAAESHGCTDEPEGEHRYPERDEEKPPPLLHHHHARADSVTYWTWCVARTTQTARGGSCGRRVPRLQSTARRYRTSSPLLHSPACGGPA